MDFYIILAALFVLLTLVAIVATIFILRGKKSPVKTGIPGQVIKKTNYSNKRIIYQYLLPGIIYISPLFGMNEKFNTNKLYYYKLETELDVNSPAGSIDQKYAILMEYVNIIKSKNIEIVDNAYQMKQELYKINDEINDDLDFYSDNYIKIMYDNVIKIKNFNEYAGNLRINNSAVNDAIKCVKNMYDNYFYNKQQKKFIQF